MQQIAPQCASCGAFTRRSLHHEEEYQSSVLLERLRTTNFPATDEQISHIRNTILPTVSADISSVDSKIASLHEVIRSMQEERESLMDLQKKYNNLVSLHRALPSEILSEVFLYTLSDYSDTNAFNASGSIWKLSHVCQRWRNIALSLHSFWSSVSLRFPQAARREGDVQRLEAVLQRSRQGPLDVYLGDDRHDKQTFSSNSSILKRMLDTIFAESYRWRQARLSFSQGGWNTLYAPLHNRLPHLESLALYSAFTPFDPEEESVVSVFEYCPRLRKFTSDGEITLVVKLPWDQITELHFSDMDLNGPCMRLIARCPSLETLFMPLGDLEDDEDDEDEYTPITCSNIRKFDVTSVPVINALTLPRLREVSLNPPPATTRYNILYSFKQLLIRSNCLSTLTSISFSSVPLAASSEHTLLSILSQTHSLTFLDLELASTQEFEDEADVSDQEQIMAIVKSLEVVPSESVTFLPLLSSLDIRVFNHDNSRGLLYFGPVGSFASTVRARWRGNDTLGLARLRRCCFAVHALYMKTNVGIFRDNVGASVVNVFTEEERHIFDTLIDEGMDLSIRVTSNMRKHVELGSRYPVFAVPPMTT